MQSDRVQAIAAAPVYCSTQLTTKSMVLQVDREAALKLASIKVPGLQCRSMQRCLLLKLALAICITACAASPIDWKWKTGRATYYGKHPFTTTAERQLHCLPLSIQLAAFHRGRFLCCADQQDRPNTPCPRPAVHAFGCSRGLICSAR
jgi:hypothetical protein